jgi:hypothetical protein
MRRISRTLVNALGKAYLPYLGQIEVEVRPGFSSTDYVIQFTDSHLEVVYDNRLGVAMGALCLRVM